MSCIYIYIQYTEVSLQYLIQKTVKAKKSSLHKNVDKRKLRLYRRGRGPHSNFSSFSLPSRLIVSVGTFINSIEKRESRPRKAFVCSR